MNKTPLSMWNTSRFRGLWLAVPTLLAPWLMIEAAIADSFTLSPGFSPNPTEVKSTTGGGVDVSTLVSRQSTQTGECTGFANREPDVTLNLKAFFKALKVNVQSAEDTALVIQGPGGLWCNDDDEDKNPGIAGEWLPGTYKIWVTTYSKNRSAPYVLRIQELR